MSCTLGTVLKTTNGGLNWQAFNTGIEASFNTIFGIDKDTVYTARNSLYKSINSCASWVDYGGLGSSSTIFDIYFSSPKTGFIIKAGKLLKTNNYGLNWYKVYEPVYSSGNILFTSQDTGYVVGGATIKCDPGPCNYPFNRGAIIKTTDGGESWQKLFFFNDTLNIISASFINNDFGYCFSSNNTIQKTEDGGLTWISIDTGITGNISGGLFINKSIGFITNIGQTGQVYITTNGGMNWDLEYTVSDGGLFEIGSSNKMVVAGGSNGLICVRNLDDLTNNKQSEYFSSKEVLIYPNPANSYFTISNPSNIKIKKIKLIDFSGRIVQLWNASEWTGNTMNIQHISPGVYLLKAETDSGVKTEKLVVQ
jgi:photosystem II stability/assembly factor-like uncharacterized protein